MRLTVLYIVLGVLAYLAILYAAKRWGQPYTGPNRSSKGWAGENTWDTLPVDWPPLGMVGIVLERDDVFLGDLPLVENPDDLPPGA
jgi:hypothetical protein